MRDDAHRRGTAAVVAMLGSSCGSRSSSAASRSQRAERLHGLVIAVSLALCTTRPRGTLAYSTMMLDDANCDRALEMQTVIMGQPIASRDAQRRPIVTNTTGDEISEVQAGTAVSVSFEVAGQMHVLETSAGAFNGLSVGCQDQRTTSTDVTLTIPVDTDGQIIVLRAAFAAGYGAVTLAQEVQLTVIASHSQPGPSPVAEPAAEPESPSPPPTPTSPSPPLPTGDLVVVAAGPEPTIVVPGRSLLPLSQASTLLLLTHVSSGGIRTSAGRSYDGFEWEAVGPSALTNLQFDCGSDGCYVILPQLGEGDYYEIKQLEGPDPATNSEAASCVPHMFDPILPSSEFNLSVVHFGHDQALLAACYIRPQASRCDRDDRRFY